MKIQLVGSGGTYDEAVLDALRNEPPRDDYEYDEHTKEYVVKNVSTCIFYGNLRYTVTLEEE